MDGPQPKRPPGRPAYTTKQKILAKVELARRDFETFVSLMTAFKPARHQRKWIRELQDVIEGKTRELLIVAPRGAGKSTIVGILYVAWQIGNNPDGHYGVISYADKVAWNRTSAVRRIIQHHNVYHLIFPGVKPDFSNWSRGSLSVQRKDLSDPHPTLMAAGATSAIISYRLDGMVYDDPHDVRNSKTAHRRKQVVETYDQAIVPCLIEGAWTVCIATRYAEDDLPGVFITRGFKTVHQRAKVEIYDTSKKPARREESYWAEKYSLEHLNELQERSPESFALNYQGDTTGGKGQIIKQIHTYLSEELPGKDDLLTAGGCDTCYKDKQEADYNVIYIGGLDKKGNIFILHREKNRFDVTDFSDLVISLWDSPDTRFTTLKIEDTAKGTPAVDVIRKKAARVPLELENPASGGKRSRASAIASYINSGQVKFPKMADWLPDAEYYLLHYGHADHDDDVDALYLLITHLLNCIHPENYGAGRPRIKVRMR